MSTRRSTRTIAAAVFMFAATAFTAGCGSSSSPTSPAPVAAGPVTVDMKGIAGDQSYAPNPVTMRVGQQLIWRNVDTRAHTSTQDTAGGFETGTLQAGQSSTPLTMSTAGTFPYHCRFHVGMVGTITVQ